MNSIFPSMRESKRNKQKSQTPISCRKKEAPAQIQECNAGEINYIELYLSTIMSLFLLFNFITSKRVASSPLRLKLLHRYAQSEILNTEAKSF